MLGAMMGVPLPMNKGKLDYGRQSISVGFLASHFAATFEHFLSGIDARYADIRQTEEQILRLKQAFAKFSIAMMSFNAPSRHNGDTAQSKERSTSTYHSY